MIRAVTFALIIALTSATSLSDYDTTINGNTLDGKYIHFQSLRYPERWVRGWYQSTNKLKIKEFTERQVYDESVTQWKVKHLGNNVLVLEFMRRPSRYIRMRDNDKDMERSETTYPDDKNWAKWKILCTDTTMDDCIIQSQKDTNKYFDSDSSKKLQRSSFGDPRSRFRVLAPTPSEYYASVLSTENTGSADLHKTIVMYEGISETSSTTLTVSASVTAEVQAAFGSGSATLSTEWSQTTSNTWTSSTTISIDITVPAGKKVNVKQLVGVYGPFSVRSAHFFIEETDAATGKKREITKDGSSVRKLENNDNDTLLQTLDDDIAGKVLEDFAAN
eukprot:TCONS_00071164-protein